MKKSPPADAPDEYVAALDGWKLDRVAALRIAVRTVPELTEAIKWGHLVYSFDGPVLLIRAESERVLFGFWRGQRLLGIEPRLTGSGKYEMAALELLEDTKVEPSVARSLAAKAVALNRELGDPRLAAKKGAKRAKK